MTNQHSTSSRSQPVAWRRNPAVFSRTDGKEWTALLGKADPELSRWKLKVFYPPLKPIRTITKQGVPTRPPPRRDRLRPEPLLILFTLYYDERSIAMTQIKARSRRPPAAQVRTECVRWAAHVFRKLAQKVRELKTCY